MEDKTFLCKNLWIYVKIKSDHADYEDYLSDDYGITDSMRESSVVFLFNLLILANGYSQFSFFFF